MELLLPQNLLKNNIIFLLERLSEKAVFFFDLSIRRRVNNISVILFQKAILLFYFFLYLIFI